MLHDFRPSIEHLFSDLLGICSEDPTDRLLKHSYSNLYTRIESFGN